MRDTNKRIVFLIVHSVQKKKPKQTKYNKMKNIQPQTAKYVEISEIVPNDWKDWFFNDLSENAPFSWGDNNRTLVSADRLKDHALDVLDMVQSMEEDEEMVSDIPKYKEAFLDTLSYLEAEQIYIDLEH